MATTLNLLLITLGFIFTSRLIYAEIDIPTMMQEAESCRTKNNMTQEEYDACFTLKIPSSPEGKCFLFCMMRFVTVVNEDGKLNIEGCKAMLAEAPASDEDKKKMQDIPELCDKEAEIKEGDPCESAYNIVMCMKKKAEEKGIQPPF
ncbi:hypothetical protein O3M35_000865 [Rhynocoris fuscipes]|uniref:Uncharacterized protein n=1 Tax=Rhynocoris fuscipes TaxID=488301 RepID=A0AAW1DPW9_9HEMI